MLNVIWLGMLVLSVVTGIIQGRMPEVVSAITESARLGFEIALGLAGVMTLWLGIMQVATACGLVTKLARLLRPVMRPLFPEVPAEHPAMGAMLLNISANMLGLANAATPFGIQAMKELERLNTRAGVATDAMCTFLAINTSSVQLIPATAIAFLAANGNTSPGSVIVTALIATCASTAVAIITVRQFGRFSRARMAAGVSHG